MTRASGEQHGVFWVSVGFSGGDVKDPLEQRRKTLAFLFFPTFQRVVYATVGGSLVMYVSTAYIPHTCERPVLLKWELEEGRRS